MVYALLKGPIVRFNEKLFSSIFIQEILESVFFIIKIAAACSQESLCKLNC